MENYIGYIYSITNEINGKTYIGKTNDLVRRWKEHYYGKGNTASRICGLDVTHIVQCLKGVYYTSWRYIWRYKEGKYPKHIEVPQVKHHWARSVLQYNLDKELIAEYDNITTAANSTNIGRTSINNCLHGRSRTAGGYIWKYKEEEVI